MEKLIINPGRVRALGNIVSSKGFRDFYIQDTTISTGTDAIYGPVFNSGGLDGPDIELTAPKMISGDAESFDIELYVADAIGATYGAYWIWVTVNGEAVVMTSPSSDTGKSTVTVSTDSSLRYDVRAVCDNRTGTGAHGGGYATAVVYIEPDDGSLELFGDKSIIQSGDTCNLVARLTDTEGEGVPFAPVDFYGYFENGARYPLDGSDRITKWTTATNTTADGVFTSHGSFLSDGWDNTRQWKLEFDYKYVSTQGLTEFKYIGLLICSEEIAPFTDAKAVDYGITTWEGGFGWSGLGRNGWISQPESTPSVTQTDWTHCEIVKLSDTRLQITINDEFVWVGEFPNLVDLEVLHIGTRDNPSDRDTGSSIFFRDVEVRYL